MTIGIEQVTAEALIRFQRGKERYELIRGELRQMTPAGHIHGRIAARLTGKLILFVESNKLGAVYAAETGFLIEKNPDTVRAPDVGFVKAHRLTDVSIKAEGYFPGSPDLAIEVVSPSDTYSEVQEKVIEWLNAGTEVVVIVDPRKKTVSVYRQHAETLFLTINDTLSIPDLLPGWNLLLNEIFL